MNAKKVLQLSVGPIGAAMLGLITLPIVAWFFSVEDVGRLTMLQVVIGLSVSFFSLAMHQAYVREYNEENDKHALFKTSVFPGLVFLFISTIAILTTPFSISEALFGIHSKFLTALLLVGIFSSFIINFLAHIIRMQERGLAFSATQITPKAFLLILIGLIFLLKLKTDFQILMTLNTLALFSSLIIFSWLTRDTWLSSIKKNIDKELLKRMLRFSLPLVAGGLAYWGLTTMDKLFLRSMSGFNELGVYSMAVALAAGVSVISTIFSNIWHPVIYKWVKEGVEPCRVQGIIENMLLIVVTIWSLVGLFSGLLPYFFPPEYKAIEYLVVACITMPLFYMLSETTVVGIGITRRSSFAMLASIAAFISNVILNYTLIPLYGASGAALASMFAFFVFFIFRTEASAWLWISLPRLKIYISVIAYMAVTVLMVLTKANLAYFNFAWITLLLLVIFLFLDRIKKSFFYLNNYAQKGI